MRNLKTIHETTTSFLYVIGWTMQNQWYIGVRYAKGCHPSDLWTRYFTSSKAVHSFSQENGPPDYMMTFVGSEEEVKLAEYKYQVEYKLFENKNWLNLQGGGRYFHITKEGIRKGMETAKKTRAKPGWTEKRSNATKLAWANPENRKKQTEAIRKARLGSMHTPAAKQKMSLSQKQNPRIWTDSMRESARARMTAREPLNKEQLERIAEKLRRRKRPDEVKKKISEKLTGRVLTEEQKMKIRLKSVKSNFNKFTRYLLDHQIYTSTEWKIHLKNHTIPDYIPRRPDKFYPNRGDDFSWTMWKKINPSST